MFTPPDDDQPPRLSAYRKRLQRVAACAYDLGRRRAEARIANEPVAKSLGAATALVDRRPISSAPVSTARLVPAERAELLLLARKLSRLAPSHRDPEAYFVEKNSIVHALRRLAK